MKRVLLGLIFGLPATFAGIQPAQAADWQIQITGPVNYQTFQRGDTNQATFTVRGWYIGNPRQIQASWRGGPWYTIDNTLTAGQGSFQGTMTGTAGQGTLVVKFSGTTLIDKVYYIGVGDIFVMAGQSNAMGMGLNSHQYAPTATTRATMLGNNDQWAELRDPYDSNVGQVDPVSSDSLAAGSFVAWIANAHLRKTGVPLAFIPAARGGSAIAQWAPSTSRTTLYGSMLRRVNMTGGKVKAVLWFQGETDVATSVESYRDQLSNLADAVNRDFRGAKLMPAILGPASWSGLSRVGARIGTIQAVENNDNLVMGPALYDVNIDDEGADGTHFQSERDLAAAGGRFWKALDHAFYGGEVGYGPQLEETTLTENRIELDFDSDLIVTAVPDSFWVLVDGARVPVVSVESDGDTVQLTLEAAPVGQVTVSYGHDNRSAIGAAIYNSSGLPAIPFHEIEVNHE